MEQPPSNTDAQLAEYLTRQLSLLQNQIDNAAALNVLTALPAKPLVGKMYYFGNTIAPTITTAGVWAYKSTGWSFLG